MSLTLNRLVFLQLLYCAAGLLYNVASMLESRVGDALWAPTDPGYGVVALRVVKRAGAANKVLQIVIDGGLEVWIVFQPRVVSGQVVQRVSEGFRNETSSVRAKMPIRIWQLTKRLSYG